MIKNRIKLSKILLQTIALMLISMMAGGGMVFAYFFMQRNSVDTTADGQARDAGNNDSKSFNLPDNLAAAASYLKFKEVRAEYVPTGVPDVYGAELNISFDDVQDAINKVRVYGPTYGEEGQKLILTGNDLERYKNIGALIACEYCCGVTTLTREDGSAACGCAHSIMMRGLAAYLIINYPEVSDEWILEELSKWKRTYFPKQTLSAELARLAQEGESGIQEMLEEFPDFLPQMVGGC